MKKIASLLMALAIMLTCLPVSVSAAEPPLVLYTANSYWSPGAVSRYPFELKVINGNMMVEAAILGFFYELDYRFDLSTVRFERPGTKGSVNFKTKEIILNEEKITPKVPPVKTGGQLLLGYEDAAKLMGAKVVIRKATLDKEYSYFQEKGKNIYKKGTVVRYIDFMPKLSKEYSDKQLTFMQGLSAPLLLHNLYDDSTKIDLSRMEDRMSFLRPYDGYTLSSAGIVASVKTSMELYWGITDRDSNIKAIKGLIASGKDPDVPYSAYDLSRAVQLAQWGCKELYLTADEAVKYGMQAAAAAQKQYDSWNAFGDDYLRGYAAYGGSGGTEGAMYKARKTIVDYIYKDNKFMGVAWK